MTPLGALDRLVRPEAPAERLATVRWLVGGFAALYVLIRLPHLLRFRSFAADRFEPVGLVALLAHHPVPGGLHVALVALTAVSGLGFLFGWRYRVTGPLFGALLLWVMTYRNSWGQVFHTENLLVLHVLVLALVPAADVWSLDARRRGSPSPAPSREYGWPLALMSLATVVAYMLAGIAKLRFGGDPWLTGAVLRNTIAADTLRKILLGSLHSPLAPLLLGQRWLFVALAWATMVLELGAPLALLGRRVAAVWVLAIIGFHFGVLALMAIGFPYPMSGIAFASMFRAERLGIWVRRRLRRGTQSS